VAAKAGLYLDMSCGKRFVSFAAAFIALSSKST